MKPAQPDPPKPQRAREKTTQILPKDSCTNFTANAHQSQQHSICSSSQPQRKSLTAEPRGREASDALLVCRCGHWLRCRIPRCHRASRTSRPYISQIQNLKSHRPTIMKCLTFRFWYCKIVKCTIGIQEIKNRRYCWNLNEVRYWDVTEAAGFDRWFSARCSSLCFSSYTFTYLRM